MAKCTSIITAFLLLFYASQAAARPEFKVEIEYRLPSSADGKVCVNECGTGRTACDTTCATDFRSCQAKADADADQEYREALRSYEDDLASYDRRYAACEKEATRGGEKEAERCVNMSSQTAMNRCLDQVVKAERARLVQCTQMRTPTKPSLSSVKEDLYRDYRCTRECGCDREHDSCYVGCGGDILRRTVCVRDCDADADKNMFDTETPSPDVALVYLYREKKFMAGGQTPAIYANGETILKVANGTVNPYWVEPGRIDFAAKALFGRAKPLSMDLRGGSTYFIQVAVGNSTELRDVPEPLARTQMYELELMDDVRASGVGQTSFSDCDSPPPAFSACAAQLPRLNYAYYEAYRSFLSWSESASREVEPSFSEEKDVSDQIVGIDRRIFALEEESKRKNRAELKDLRKERKTLTKELKKREKVSLSACRDVGKSASKHLKGIERSLSDAYKATSKAMKKGAASGVPEWQRSLSCSRLDTPELLGCTTHLGQLGSAYAAAYDDLNSWSAKSARQISSLQSQAVALADDLSELNGRIESLSRDKRKNRKDIRQLNRDLSATKKKIKQNKSRQKDACKDLAEELSARVGGYDERIAHAIRSTTASMRR